MGDASTAPPVYVIQRTPSDGADVVDTAVSVDTPDIAESPWKVGHWVGPLEGSLDLEVPTPA
jgi:hypothetical protein